MAMPGTDLEHGGSEPCLGLIEHTRGWVPQPLSESTVVLLGVDLRLGQLGSPQLRGEQGKQQAVLSSKFKTGFVSKDGLEADSVWCMQS